MKVIFKSYLFIKKYNILDITITTKHFCLTPKGYLKLMDWYIEQSLEFHRDDILESADVLY